MIGVLHAYSRTNAGDGLLVDLTLERLRRLGVNLDEVLLVALDPASFPEVPEREGAGARGRGLAWELVPAAGRAMALASYAVTGRSWGRLARRLAGCDALVAVGGGYLRTPNVTSAVGTALNHLPQLLVAARSSRPTVYLPQSIGPLPGPVGAAVRRCLRRIDVVGVRDSVSETELPGVSGLRRVPDLAVLDIAERWQTIQPAEPDGRVVLVARRVDHALGYEECLRTVAGRFGDGAVWGVQSGGDPSKSDAVHYDRLGLGARHVSLADQLAGGEASVVVSVRLHGALMALAAGVPAIHLAYDRKGPAAFADLGLSQWCFDVRRLDGNALADAIEGLLRDPNPYWASVAERASSLAAASADLDGLISRVLKTRP